MLAGLLDFVTPDFSDPLQLLFFVPPVVLVVAAVAAVLCFARPRFWERHWKGPSDKPHDDFDFEHGTVHDLSDMVATGAERMYEALPGLLLVYGLLGTFLGLGIALNNASNLLEASSDLQAVNSSMAELMGMLNGLGAKFKTSTWGLSAFITLKMMSPVLDHERRRLRWTVIEVNKAIGRERKKDEKWLKEISDYLVPRTDAKRPSNIKSCFDEILTAQTVLVSVAETFGNAADSMAKSGDELIAAVDKFSVQSRESADSIGKAVDAAMSGMSKTMNAFNHEFKSSMEGLKSQLEIQNRMFGEMKTHLDASGVKLIEITAHVLPACEKLMDVGQSFSAALEENQRQLTTAMGFVSNGSNRVDAQLRLLKDEVVEFRVALLPHFEKGQKRMASLDNGLETTDTLAGSESAFERNMTDRAIDEHLQLVGAQS